MLLVLRSFPTCVLCFFIFTKLEVNSQLLELDKYRTFDEINQFISAILEKHNETTTEVIIGKSFESRDIRGIKISTKTEDDNNTRPAILVDGGIHAREWVSTVAVLYTIHQLLENSSNYDLIDNIDWYILPMLNPDGYIYTMDPNGNRLWRKSRGGNLLSECRGTDLNRNFDFAWGGAGSSKNPCDWNYRGPYPFSEPESKALANYIVSKMPQIQMYLTLHSAAQAIIYPWGFSDERPPDWKELDALAKRAAKEMLKINQTVYLVGPTTETVGVGAGGSDDWAKGSAGVKFVFTMELPGLGYPAGGFHPPESALPIISEETFLGIRVFASHLISISNKTHEEPPSTTPLLETVPSFGLPLGPSVLPQFASAPHWYNPFIFGYPLTG